jgi:hypothetical protein
MQRYRYIDDNLSVTHKVCSDKPAAADLTQVVLATSRYKQRQIQSQVAPGAETAYFGYVFCSFVLAWHEQREHQVVPCDAAIWLSVCSP